MVRFRACAVLAALISDSVGNRLRPQEVSNLQQRASVGPVDVGSELGSLLLVLLHPPGRRRLRRRIRTMRMLS